MLKYLDNVEKFLVMKLTEYGEKDMQKGIENFDPLSVGFLISSKPLKICVKFSNPFK